MSLQLEAITNTPIIDRLLHKEEVLYLNPTYDRQVETTTITQLKTDAIDDAQARLERFAPFIEAAFPETKITKGIIESPLSYEPDLQQALAQKFHCKIPGKLFIKQDNNLAIAGSVKARGGIYEVLKYAETLAINAGILSTTDSYEKLTEQPCKDFFSNYTIQAGSTGNLGLSIGIISAALGFRVIIHMSSDAKEWKKNLLREHGVQVIEYDSDYSQAVTQGRMISDQNPNSYFADDENSKDLFYGYATAARRLQLQLEESHITIDKDHPLFVYLPCGVGGAPGGITYGLKTIFSEHVHCFFVEPTEAPCMLLGMSTNLHNDICVQDLGLSGTTIADGLAVGRPSKFVGTVMSKILSGIFTVTDQTMKDYLKIIFEKSNLFLEPSACASFIGVTHLYSDDFRSYLRANDINEKRMENACHIAWATGGSLIPHIEKGAYLR